MRHFVTQTSHAQFTITPCRPGIAPRPQSYPQKNAPPLRAGFAVKPRAHRLHFRTRACKTPIRRAAPRAIFADESRGAAASELHCAIADALCSDDTRQHPLTTWKMAQGGAQNGAASRHYAGTCGAADAPPRCSPAAAQPQSPLPDPAALPFDRAIHGILMLPFCAVFMTVLRRCRNIMFPERRISAP